MSRSAGDNVEATLCQPGAITTDVKYDNDTTNVSDCDETSYPEGGLQAWLVVLGSFCGM